jgi:hypothetical protein
MYTSLNESGAQQLFYPCSLLVAIQLCFFYQLENEVNNAPTSGFGSVTPKCFGKMLGCTEAAWEENREQPRLS